MENRSLIKQCTVEIRCLDRNFNWVNNTLQGNLIIPKKEMTADEMIDFYTSLALKITKDHGFEFVLVLSISLLDV